MGSLLKASVVVGFFLLLLPALVYCERFVNIELFVDKNCTIGPENNRYFRGYYEDSHQPNVSVTFDAFPFNRSETFESAILANYTAVVSLVACQALLPCNATGAFQISFNLSDIGACSTAGFPGTQFDKVVLS